MKNWELEELEITNNSDILTHLREFAAKNKIPIIQETGIAFLMQIIRIGKVSKILEIGTAMGYSAIAMALLSDANIVSIERDQTMFQLAEKNVQLCGLKDRISLIYDDALTMDDSLLGIFDLIFIDAAKGQNLPLFQKFEGHVLSGGIILIDNLLFHGFVENPETIISRDRRQMIHKIQQFNDFLLHNEQFDAQIYDFGDGIGLAIKK